MRFLRWLAMCCAGFLLLSTVQSWAVAPQAGTAAQQSLAVGKVSEVDTEAVRRILERAQPKSAPPALTPLVLTLEQAIRVALESNLQLQIVQLDRNTADALVPAARAKFHPTPGFTVNAAEQRLVDEEEGSGTRKTEEQFGGPFVRQELPTAGTVIVSKDVFRRATHAYADPTEPDSTTRYEGGATIELRQPLLRGGGIYVARREILDAEYDLEVLEAQLRAQILQVTALTKEAYYNTVLAQRLIEVTEEALARDRQLLQASEALFQGGRATRRDIVSAQIRISSDEASLAEHRAAFENAQLVLQDVLGTPIGQGVSAAESAVPFEPVEIRLDQWIEEALVNRPEIQAIQTRLEQSALAVRIAGNDALPALDFRGTYRRSDFNDTARRVWGFDSQIFEAGLLFEVPVGNVAARQRLRAAKFQHERVEREFRQQSRLIEIEVRNEEILLRENLQSLAAQTAKVEQAREKLEIANTRFRLGRADNKDVTDAQEDLVDAESDLLKAVVDYTNGVARLEARVAGPL